MKIKFTSNLWGFDKGSIHDLAPGPASWYVYNQVAEYVTEDLVAEYVKDSTTKTPKKTKRNGRISNGKHSNNSTSK